MSESNSTGLPDSTAERKAKAEARYRQKNRAKAAAAARAWRKANPEKSAAYWKAWNEANKEKIPDQRRAYYEANKAHIQAQQKAYSEANKDKIRAYRKAHHQTVKVRRYGLTTEEFNAMVQAQEGRCAACRCPFNQEIKPLQPQIDHDHKTGKVRGILCRRCNLALGHAGDNAKILRALVRYLKPATE